MLIKTLKKCIIAIIVEEQQPRSGNEIPEFEDIPVYVHFAIVKNDRGGFDDLLEVSDENHALQFRFPDRLSDAQLLELDRYLPVRDRLFAVDRRTGTQSYNESFGLRGSWSNLGTPFMDERFNYVGVTTLRLIGENLPPILEKALVNDPEDEYEFPGAYRNAIRDLMEDGDEE